MKNYLISTLMIFLGIMSCAPKKKQPVDFNDEIYSKMTIKNMSRSAKDVLETVKLNMPELRAIYVAELKKSPEFSDKLRFEIVIDDKGKVKKIKLLNQSSGNDEFSREIMDTIKKWDFGPNKTNEEETLTLPMKFSDP